MTNISKRKLLISTIWTLVILLSGAQLALSINTLADGYQITNAVRDIRGYSSCYYVNSNDGNQYFFPTNTSNEFFSFVNNKPTGVTIQSCQMLYGGIHTSQECINAGGTVYNGYCRFVGYSCASGWNYGGRSDYYYPTAAASCYPSMPRCDYGSTSYSNCFTAPATWGFSATSGIPPSCQYYQPNSSYGSYTSYENVCGYQYTCSYQYVCGGYPYYCGYQNVCGNQYSCSYQYVTRWGTVCSYPTFSSCTASNYSYSIDATYCY